MDNKTRVALGFTFIIICLVFINGYLNERKIDNTLTHSHKLAEAQIISFGYNAGGASAPIKYIFKTNNGKVYESNIRKNIFCKNLSNEQEKFLKTKKFQVLYSPKNPSVNLFLFQRIDFEKYNIFFPKNMEDIFSEYFECNNLIPDLNPNKTK